MLLDSEHSAWLRDHWTGGSRQRDRMTLAGGLRKTFKISHIEAQEAVKVFLSKNEDADEDIVSILQQESVKQRKRLKTARILAVVLVSSYVILLLGIKVFHGDLNDISGLSGMFGVIGATAGLTGRHKMAARAAAKLNDKRALGSLIEILGSDDKGLRALAEDAVAEMLPSLEVDDFAALDERQREQLAKALYRTKKLSFAAAILGVFRKFASTDVIPTLELFADGKTSMNKRDFERAKSLAHMTLADVRMRGAKKKIDERVQEIGGSLPEYTSKVLEEHVDLRGS